MTLTEKDVEFKALDGTILRGSLYPASSRGPAIIMSPGFNCVKEMLGLPDVAASFHARGYTVLLYDPRCLGLSDGSPRNDIDPALQVTDYSDALTYVATLAPVDPARVFFWGMSFAAAVALCAAAADKRAAGVVAVAPLTSFAYAPERLPRVLARCVQDRASQLRGNAPAYVPMLDGRGENPAGFGVGVDRERYAKIVEAGRAIAPRHVNRTTLQSYYKMVVWQPFAQWALLPPTPVFWVVPQLDRLSPRERQLEFFEGLQTPKRLHVEPDVGHMEICEGPHVEKLMDLQDCFLKDVGGGRLRA